VISLNDIKKRIGFLFSFRSMKRHFQAIRQAREILELGGYRHLCKQHGLPIREGEDLYEHYKTKGYKAGLNPCDLFHAQWYRRVYLDHASSENPFLNYLLFGDRRGCNFFPYFNNQQFKKILLEDGISNYNSLLFLLKEKKIVSAGDLYDEYREDIKYRGCFVHFDRSLLRRKLGSFDLKDGVSFLNQRGIQYKKITYQKDRDEVYPYQKGRLIPRDPYYAKFENVMVRWGSADIIVDDKTLINDELYFALKLSDIYGDPRKDPAFFELKDGRVDIYFDVKEKKPIKEGILLTKEYEANYFHFMTEVALKLDFIERNNIFPKHLPIIVSDHLHPNIYNVLDILNVHNRQIIKIKKGVIYNVKNLYYLSDLTCNSNTLDIPCAKKQKDSVIFPKGLLRNFRQSMLERLDISKNDSGLKLGVIRYGDYRRLLNMEDIKKFMEKRGFITILPEKFTFKEQAQFFLDADVVMGPTGAAMTNLLWCEKGTKVFIFYPNHEYNNKIFWDAIGVALGLDIHYVDGTYYKSNRFSENSPQVDYKIDLSVLKKLKNIPEDQ